MCHEQNITLVVYRVQRHNTAYNLGALENPRYIFKCFRTSKQSEPENYSTARNYIFIPVEILKNPEKNGFFLDDIGIIPPLYPKEASFSNPVLLRFIVAVHFNPIELPQVRFENLLDYPHRRHESEASRSHSDSVPRADLSIHAILRSR